VHYKSTNKTFSISWQLSQRVTISSERFQSSLSTHWPLSFCEVILLAYAHNIYYFRVVRWFCASYSSRSMLVCLLTLPAEAVYSIHSEGQWTSLYVPRSQCVKQTKMLMVSKQKDDQCLVKIYPA